MVRGQGAYLYDDQGKAYLDLISSWWVNLHGHAHPHITTAIAQQAGELEHVLFAGMTHPPAIELAETLSCLLPKSLCKFFYSDNGSTSVEVALKMAYQYWRNQGDTQRTRFLAFQGGYHGDTFGSMAVGRGSHFFDAYEDLFFSVDLAPYPATWMNDDEIEDKEQAALGWLQKHFAQHGKEIAALIIEPLVQGASGMRLVRASWVRQMVELAREHNILVVFDEVMTGFGRTGTLFALEQIGETPDLLCLSKGLTGGFLPMALTVATQKIYEAFLGDDFSKSLVHGHSYTANPLGCAAALASLELFQTEQSLKLVKAIEAIHRDRLPALIQKEPKAMQPRICGSIGAWTMTSDESGYTASIGQKLKQQFLEAGLLIRPLGSEVYLLPPYCIAPADLHRTYDAIETILKQL